MGVRERIAIHAAEDCKLDDNAKLNFGNGANRDDPAAYDVTMRWDGTDFDILPAADDSVLKLGNGTLSFDVWLYGSAAANYLLWDASANLLAMGGEHFKIETVVDTKTIRLNSRNYAATSGDLIGFQSKPGANGNGTATVYGAQISPRFQDGIGGASLVGVQSDAILKGSSGNLTGDVRAFQAQITDENAAGRTIAGTISGIWFWQQLAAHTITGGVYPIHVTAAGGATAWSGLAKLPDDGGNIADLAAAIGSVNGAIKVKIGSTTCYIPTYDSYTPS